MDNEQQGELLVRIDERTKKIETDLEKVSNGGFPRCYQRKEQIEQVEKNFVWLRNGFISALLVLALSIGYKELINLQNQAQLKHEMEDCMAKLVGEVKKSIMEDIDIRIENHDIGE